VWARICYGFNGEFELELVTFLIPQAYLVGLDILVEVDDYQRIYEKARSEFPMASKENTHRYAEAALKILKKKRPALGG